MQNKVKIVLNSSTGRDWPIQLQIGLNIKMYLCYLIRYNNWSRKDSSSDMYMGWLVSSKLVLLFHDITFVKNLNIDKKLCAQITSIFFLQMTDYCQKIHYRGESEWPKLNILH